MIKFYLSIITLLITGLCFAGTGLIINVDHRNITSLGGKWNIIIDPYELGYYDYRHLPDRNGFFKNQQPKQKWDRIEYSFDSDDLLNVPGDWNSQQEKLFLYEGSLWYKKSFTYSKKPNTRVFLYFGAVNYIARVFLNGKMLGEHEGGFTPFNFEITDKLLDGENDVILMVDNKRFREAVPTVNTDWWNYGGITRRVLLVKVHHTFIRDYFVQLGKNTLNQISGWVQLDGNDLAQNMTIEIPEAGVKKPFTTNHEGYGEFNFDKKLTLWSPENPKLYQVILKSETDTLADKIGFRSIATENSNILLNNQPVFLKGICIHEEAPFMNGARAFAPEHARTLLGWAKELGCNFVRLAHYPHNEYMIRTADEMGILVWAEIPVYWTILWENQDTFLNAKNQLSELITRDKNRASVILWSMANETPLSETRLEFLKNLVEHARKLDPTRLITAAMEKHYVDQTTVVINDPFGEYVDVLGCNEYLGWYDGLPEKCDNIVWKTSYNKPVIISEVGGGALYGYHGDDLTRWTEEFQANVYEHNLKMLVKYEFIKGLTPWILKDFRSPRRPLPRIQDFWNRKGVIDDSGNKKLAFYVLQHFYKNMGEKNRE